MFKSRGFVQIARFEAQRPARRASPSARGGDHRSFDGIPICRAQRIHCGLRSPTRMTAPAGGLTAAAVCLDLQKRLSLLVPTAAPTRSSTGARMAVRSRSKFSRKPKKPIQSGASVGRHCCSRALFARGDGLVQQCPDFLAGNVARSTGLAPSVAHFVCICGKEFRFQGVKQRRQSGLRKSYANHGQDQTKPWRSIVRRIRRRAVSYSTAVRP